jgi:alkanesulfonate monooxygenase SsuD/methylene tetrahydromethanopterin reductase-like flavin-dependent oxidoreductase (luciferase family)
MRSPAKGMNVKMKLSYFMMPLHDIAKPYAQQLAEDADAVLLADELGFSEAWCGEHFSSGAELITSPLMFFASLLPRTRNLTFATGVACLPHHHPAVYAGHAAMFDHLSGGRLIFGVGPGGLQSDFELFGTEDKNRMEMLAESLETIIKLWTSKPPYDIRGKYWNSCIQKWHMDDVGLGWMAPVLQRPHPPIAITASSPNSGSLKVAGKRGWLPVTANFIGAWSVKTHWQVYEAAARQAGHEVTRDNWRVARSVYVAPTDDEAERFVKQPKGAFDYYFWYLYTLWDRGGIKGAYVPAPGMTADQLTSHEMLRDDYVIWGSPQTVAQKLLAFREEVGHFGNLLLAAHDWTDKAAMRRSMTLMAREVMPAVNRAIGESEQAAA